LLHFSFCFKMEKEDADDSYSERTVIKRTFQQPERCRMNPLILKDHNFFKKQNIGRKLASIAISVKTAHTHIANHVIFHHS